MHSVSANDHCESPLHVLPECHVELCWRQIEDGIVCTIHARDALGHAAFDYVETRWGRASIRRFVNALLRLASAGRLP